MSGGFTLHGSPHSLPTYRVALMIRLSRTGFTFRYVSFQRGMHLTPEFRALSRWGQVPVLEHEGRVFVQSAAILEYLAETLDCFAAADVAARQHIREWLFGMPTGSCRRSMLGMASNWAGASCCRSHSIRCSWQSLTVREGWLWTALRPIFRAITSSWVIGQPSPTSVATPTLLLPGSATKISRLGPTSLIGPTTLRRCPASPRRSTFWRCRTPRSDSNRSTLYRTLPQNFSTRDIAEGEELTIDSSRFSEQPYRRLVAEARR
jgi:Glutathione S-transferase, N-terminal domain